MIPFSGKVMRQCNRLSKIRMQFIPETTNEKSTMISLSKMSIEDSTNATDDLQSLDYTQSDSSYGQGELEQELDENHRQPSYMEYYPQYPQQLQYIQQPLPYVQNYPTPYQYGHYYSTCAASTNPYATTSSNTHIQVPKSSAITIKKPADYIEPSKKPAKPPILDDKEQLKLERQRLAEIRRQETARFKSLLDSLPLLDFPPHYKVECITDSAQANAKILQLVEEDKNKKFGLDLEWPPCFVKGKSENKVSLVQICSANRILLIQLSRMQGIPIELRRFFESKEFLKSGVNIGADGLKLQRDFGIVTNGLVELRDLAESGKSQKLKVSHLRSLRALTGLFLDQNMAKGSVRISNWARHELTPLQVKYAALDAYASYELFMVLEKFLDPKKKIGIRHLIDEQQKQAKPDTTTKKPKKKKVQSYSSSQELSSQPQHKYNRSSPTSTVTIIKRKPSK